jgi:hypothetical protein
MKTTLDYLEEALEKTESEMASISRGATSDYLRRNELEGAKEVLKGLIQKVKEDQNKESSCSSSIASVINSINKLKRLV